MKGTEKNQKGSLVVDCPNCKKAVNWSPQFPYRPFCSERCKLIDLGEWASGNRYIPSDAEQDAVTAQELGKDQQD
ncbi:MAG: DNA gyrase inhibitor YacG [Gammaproteobacteria bacterium]|nr:DNA gyrase inhibitor YacG [Gammaproteobacteria bacterium]